MTLSHLISENGEEHWGYSLWNMLLVVVVVVGVVVALSFWRERIGEGLTSSRNSDKDKTYFKN